MASKKRNVDAECCSFKDKWTNEFFFVKVKGKSVCLVCEDAVAVMKKTNLARHYSVKHAKLDVLKGQVPVDKVVALWWSLIGQQAVLSKLRADQDNMMQASFVVRELIIKKLKRHAEGEFVDRHSCSRQEKIKLFQSVYVREPSQIGLLTWYKTLRHHWRILKEISSFSFQNWLLQRLGSAQDWLTQTWTTSWE